MCGAQSFGVSHLDRWLPQLMARYPDICWS